MTVALADNALVTLADAQAFLGVRAEANEDAVTGIINRASDFCEAYTRRPLARRTYEDLGLMGRDGCVLRPPAVPIDAEGDITIEVDGVVQTIWRSYADGDPVEGRWDVLVASDVDDARWRPNYFHRFAGWLGSTPQPIRLAYTGGFKVVPGDLVDAVLLVCENIWRQSTGHAADVASFASGPVTPGVTYRDSLIPLKAKRILDLYRVMTV